MQHISHNKIEIGTNQPSHASKPSLHQPGQQLHFSQSFLAQQRLTAHFETTHSSPTTRDKKSSYLIKVKDKHRLTVLLETHGNSALTENLSLHVDSVLSHKSHTSQTASDTARTGSLAVVAWVGGV